MKREEFLLGAVIFALIFTAGFSGPVLKKLGRLPWDKPLGPFIRELLRPSPPAFALKTRKTLLAARVRQALKPGGRTPAPTMARDVVQQKLEENWERMASHPAVLPAGNETSRFFPRVFGKKTGLKSSPAIPEKKPPHSEDATRG